MFTTIQNVVHKSKSKKAEPQGLCINCKHRETCMLLRGHREPIQFCETYEVETPFSLKNVREPSKKVKPNKSMKTSETYKGLCSNCSNREVCTFPKPECGVWHCEEYA